MINYIQSYSVVNLFDVSEIFLVYFDGYVCIIHVNCTRSFWPNGSASTGVNVIGQEIVFDKSRFNLTWLHLHIYILTQMPFLNDNEPMKF